MQGETDRHSQRGRSLGPEGAAGELADQQPHDNKQMHAYSEAHTMAEWPVFMAYVRLVGPVCVLSVPAGATFATTYTWTDPAPSALSAPPPGGIFFGIIKTFYRGAFLTSINN